MLTNIFNNFFHPLSLAFLGFLAGAAAIGLSIGYWIWGTLARKLTIAYNGLNNELAAAKQPEKKTDDVSENDKMRRFAKQVEAERNRLLVENKDLQKRTRKLEELERERNQLWQELLDVKEQLYSHENAENINWQLENQKLYAELMHLKEKNAILQDDLDTQLDYLKNQLLKEADEHDQAKLTLRQIQIDFKAVVSEQNTWQQRYETARENNQSPNLQTHNSHFDENEQQPVETTTMRVREAAEKTWQANDANLAEARKNEVRQLLEDRWLTTSPDERDPLQRIVGIGLVAEQQLNNIGIYSFEQLSRLDDFLVQKVAEALNIAPPQIAQENWVGQAKGLLNK